MTASIVDRFACEVEGHEWRLLDVEAPLSRHMICVQCGAEDIKTLEESVR